MEAEKRTGKPVITSNNAADFSKPITDLIGDGGQEKDGENNQSNMFSFSHFATPSLSLSKQM